MKKYNHYIFISILLCFSIFLIYLNLFFNLPEDIKEQSIIIKHLRYPAIVTALFCGIILSSCGLSSQTYFQNPLATQDILGINAASSFGAILFLYLSQFNSFPSFINIFVFAFIFSLSFSLCLIFLSSIISSILIFGILSSFFFFSLNSILLALSSDNITKKYLMWNFGSFNQNNFSDTPIIIFLTIFLFFSFFLFSKPLNILLIGTNKAFHEGVNLKLTKIIFLILSSLSISISVIIAGPIGFIGITAPHVARMIFKTHNHYLLFPISSIIGTLLCLTALLLSKIIEMKYIHLPINPIISILSSPFIIYLLFTKKLKKYDII